MMFRPDQYKNELLIAMVLMTGTSLPNYANAITTDGQINSLISQAIETHPLVQSAKAERQATVEGVTAAKLNLLPTPSIATSFNDDDNLVSEVGLRQPLWTGGRLTANINQAIYDEKAAQENIFAQQNQVAKTTIEAWQVYIAAVAQQRVYADSLARLRKSEEMMKRRVSQGVSARIELELVANRILQEENGFAAAKEQQRIAEARLQQITGHALPVGNERNVPALKDLVAKAKKEAQSYEKMAFNEASFSNPNVFKEQFQIESAKQEVKAQNASRFPVLYAEYKYTYDHDSREDEGKFYVGLNYQPGAGFSNIALTRASEARVNSLIHNKEAARRSVMESIQVEYQQFASAKSREISLVSAVAGAQIVLDSYERQFKAGRKTWNEVLNAVRELSDYEIRLVQTRSDLLGSFYKLQVDFSLMPWQSFSHNRQDTKMFSVSDPVKNWMQKQQVSLNKSEFGYEDNSRSGADDEYINLNVPYSYKQSLDEGAYIVIDEQGNPLGLVNETELNDDEVIIDKPESTEEVETSSDADVVIAAPTLTYDDMVVINEPKVAEPQVTETNSNDISINDQTDEIVYLNVNGIVTEDDSVTVFAANHTDQFETTVKLNEVIVDDNAESEVIIVEPKKDDATLASDDVANSITA